MREQVLMIGDVPTRILEPESSAGLLLLGHGGGHSKDAPRFVGLSREYANRTGLTVVSIDAVDHGDRRPPAPSPGVPAGWHSRVAARMIADWEAVTEELSTVGIPVAYVGFSMGAVFGIPTVAVMSSLQVAVFVAGGIPGDDWTDDPDLEGLLLDAASALGHSDVLMLSKVSDELFPDAGVRRLFDAMRARSKVLAFSPGSHDDWTPEMIEESVMFVNAHVRRAD